MITMYLFCEDCREDFTIQTKEDTDGAIPKGTKCTICQSENLIED